MTTIIIIIIIITIIIQIKYINPDFIKVCGLKRSPNDTFGGKVCFVMCCVSISLFDVLSFHCLIVIMNFVFCCLIVL